MISSLLGKYISVCRETQFVQPQPSELICVGRILRALGVSDKQAGNVWKFVLVAIRPATVIDLLKTLCYKSSLSEEKRTQMIDLIQNTFQWVGSGKRIELNRV